MNDKIPTLTLVQTEVVENMAKDWLKTIQENPAFATNKDAIIERLLEAVKVGYDSCYDKFNFALTEDTYKFTCKKLSELENPRTTLDS
jgi:hypothetical protein